MPRGCEKRSMKRGGEVLASLRKFEVQLCPPYYASTATVPEVEVKNGKNNLEGGSCLVNVFI